MKIAQLAAIKMTASDAPNGISSTGQRSMATVVESDIYFVVSSSITMIPVAISPTLQSITYMVERQTRKPLPPLNLNWIGYA